MPNRSKLALSIDSEVIRRAKTLARQRGVSLSALVEKHLRELTAGERTEAPIVSELRGTLSRGADMEDYRSHLEEKHAS